VIVRDEERDPQHVTLLGRRALRRRWGRRGASHGAHQATDEPNDD
jgi:hypothetical protein